MEPFHTNPISLRYLLASIHERRLALPDFQRDFVWMPRGTEQLIESISRSFPAGSLLFYPFQANTFKARNVQNAPELTGAPLELILDGQQRLTSLYQAFYGVGDHRYFVDLDRLKQDGDVEEAVFFRHRKRSGRYSTLQAQADQLVLPLGEIFGGEGFHEWRDGILDLRPEQGEERRTIKTQLNDVYGTWIKPIEDYRFPVVTLAADTDIEAVCSIFETLNSTGVSLTVFELLTARYAARGFDLRSLWEIALAELPLLSEYDVDPYYVLQAISLRERNSVRRGDVLRLSVDDINRHWDAVTRGCQAALVMLRNDCGVVTSKWLPYAYQLVPMSATWHEAIDIGGPAAGANRQLMQRWFWCAGLSQAYDRAANTQAAKDYNELRRWFGSGSPPEVVATFAFDAESLLSITPRQQSAYKALMALILRHRAKDFHDVTVLTPERVYTAGVDDHHVFPRSYLNPSGLDPSHAWEGVDCILNRTMIDAATNRRIGKRAPSDYLTEIDTELTKRVGPTAFRELLASHLLPHEHDGPLLEERFDDFLLWRKQELAAEVEAATGMPKATKTDVRALEIEKPVDDRRVHQAVAPRVIDNSQALASTKRTTSVGVTRDTLLAELSERDPADVAAAEALLEWAQSDPKLNVRWNSAGDLGLVTGGPALLRIWAEGTLEVKAWSLRRLHPAWDDDGRVGELMTELEKIDGVVLEDHRLQWPRTPLAPLADHMKRAQLIEVMERVIAGLP